MESLNYLLNELLQYSLGEGIIKEADYIYFSNVLINVYKVYNFKFEPTKPRHIVDILSDLSAKAYEMKVIESNDVQTKDNFEAHLVDLIMPRPSDVDFNFKHLYKLKPSMATDYLYNLSKKTNYIKTRRIAQNIRYKYDGKYAPLEITINLSKPEKDPAMIAKLKTMKPEANKYPKCMLCHENEGFNGNLSYDSRANMRIIPIEFEKGDNWFFQYSPYSYFNEHAIILNSNHQDMAINAKTFKRLIRFIEMFPTYFIGSNADLPIVGGSILNHDHYQAGNYHFPIEYAKEELVRKMGNVDVYKVCWPLSTIRIKSKDKKELMVVANYYLNNWISYENTKLNIINSKAERHNTITPIARRHGDVFELDLILRCNITTDEYPLGIFHPHANLHHIKKENIGLIEAAGMAILPARLKTELAICADYIKGVKVDETKIASHLDWLKEIKPKYNKKMDAQEFIYTETGKVFEAVLCDAGVFKDNDEGNKAFLEFINE